MCEDVATANKDFTLLIQGRLDQDTVEYYSQYVDYLPIVISTWVDNAVDLSNLTESLCNSASVKVVHSNYPPQRGDQNFYYQLHSTMANMFSLALERYSANQIGPNSCEPGLTKAHMLQCGFTQFDNLQQGKECMGRLFRLITLDKLEPYKVKTNVTNRVWYSEVNRYIPHNQGSIDDLSQL